MRTETRECRQILDCCGYRCNNYFHNEKTDEIECLELKRVITSDMVGLNKNDIMVAGFPDDCPLEIKERKMKKGIAEIHEIIHNCSECSYLKQIIEFNEGGNGLEPYYDYECKKTFNRINLLEAQEGFPDYCVWEIKEEK